MAINFIENFSDAWINIKQSIEKLYDIIIFKATNKSDTIIALRRLDVNKLILQDLGFITEIDKLLGANVNVLGKIKAFKSVTNESLTALIQISKNAYIGAIGASALEIKQLMIQSVLGGLPANEFAKQLVKTGLSKAQANILASDTIAVFERSVTMQMALNGDLNKLFNWRNPIDNKTSQNDLDVMARNPQTMAQINDGLLLGLPGGAHMNCRGAIEPHIV